MIFSKKKVAKVVKINLNNQNKIRNIVMLVKDYAAKSVNKIKIARLISKRSKTKCYAIVALNVYNAEKR
jgi:hypothetical protein